MSSYIEQFLNIFEMCQYGFFVKIGRQNLTNWLVTVKKLYATRPIRSYLSFDIYTYLALGILYLFTT